MRMHSNNSKTEYNYSYLLKVCNLWILKSHSIKADVNTISFKQTVNNYNCRGLEIYAQTTFFNRYQ
ncbi:MAG: hypothetical protein A4E24_01463 [Methanomethylovorans sp. PtaU1.Bin093]|nr:MAG: hypothetical protein A4E24_01463 [Methanomethylovorans sp. PtaU1.Bin093]